jgi:hypothetical protein
MYLEMQLPCSTHIVVIGGCLKAETSTFCSETGRHIDGNEEQLQKAEGSISISFDPVSNVIDGSTMQTEKRLCGTTSTDTGMQIDLVDEQDENECGATRVGRDAHSHAIK